jgi:hypothetical protein
MVFPFLLTLYAIGNAAGKAFFLQVLKASLIVWEAFMKILNGESQVLWNALFNLHLVTSLKEGSRIST